MISTRTQDEQNALDQLFLNSIDRLDKMKELYAQGANINARLKSGILFYNDRTAVHQIIRQDFCSERDADYDDPEYLRKSMESERDKRGYEKLEWLFENGADFNAREIDGYNPLHVAIDYERSVALVQYLCDRGVDPNAVYHRGKISGQPCSVLRSTMSTSNLEYIACLCENGAKFTPKDIRDFMEYGVCSIKVRKPEIRAFLLANMQTTPMSFLALDANAIRDLNAYMGENIFEKMALIFHDRYMGSQDPEDLKISMIYLLQAQSYTESYLYRYNLGALIKMQNRRPAIGFFASQMRAACVDDGTLSKVVVDLKEFYISLVKEYPNPFVLSCLNSLYGRQGLDQALVMDDFDAKKDIKSAGKLRQGAIQDEEKHQNCTLF